MSITMVLKGGDTLKKRLKKDLQKMTLEMAEDYKKYIKKYTPVATGNAQRGWSLKKTQKGAKLTNPVPYISYLENGWSKQAKSGMTKPAKDMIDSLKKAGEYKMNKKRK